MLSAPPLDAAQTCYEALDYDCAEARLAEALARPLTPAESVKARRLDALLAFAFRDDARIRRAARAIYALDPQFVPEGMPRQLARIFELERPEPPPPPGLHLRLDYSATVLSGHDAEQWSYGLGVAGEAGVRLFDRLILAIGARYDDHQPLDFVQNGMTLLAFEAIVGWRQPLGPIRFIGGISGGGLQVDIDGALNDSSYWGGLLSGVIDVSWPIWTDLGIGARFAPTVFVTSEVDRLATSSLLPFTVGLRYGP